MTEWQDISGVPKDGSWVMLHYHDKCVPLITFWETDAINSECNWKWAHASQLGINEPTHWQPLPNPPGQSND